MNAPEDLKDMKGLALDADVHLQAPQTDTLLRGAGAGAAQGVRAYLGRSPDIVVRYAGAGATVLFVRSVVDLARLESAVLGRLEGGGRVPRGAECTVVGTVGEAARAALDGACVLFDAAVEGAVAMPMAMWPARSPEEPPSETVIDGPHNGFVEDLSTNIGLVRKYVRSPALAGLRGRAKRLCGLCRVIRPG